MSDLRRAAEMALEALETLWGILDDIDTASDMAKDNDAWYRKRVEALQKKRWDTTITTDGYKLKGGPVEALRTALARQEQECIYPECETGIGCDGPCGEKPVDAVSTSQKCETTKRKHEPVFTKDEIIRMAKKAGLAWVEGLNGAGYGINKVDDLQNFAAIVATRTKARSFI